jgi:flagellar biosynthesis protein FlhA
MEKSATGTTFSKLLRSGLAAPILVIMVLAMMTMPIPPLLLDLFFTFNIALSLLVLLAAIYALRPLDFSAFPTILLTATLLRLALNIASTRIVLLEGHTGAAAAGDVIEAFGSFVVGGNFAVGLVVFAILVIINFVVVTKGAGRVSEVTARFTLDAMPGKQMAVDADLNAGILTQEQARVRREEITREADFYGSMDGSSKFVRGDAIAGILILFINVIGGLAIGVGQHGLGFGDALEKYTLLAIGDGLVAQIPSLLLSTATAIIVTRVSDAQDMGTQMMNQMFKDPRPLWVTAGILGLLGIIPGMPNLVFLSLAGLSAFAAVMINPGIEQEQETEPAEADALPASGERELSWDDVKPVDTIGLEVGYKLIPMVDKEQDGSVLNRIKGVRRKLSETLGFLIPSVHIKDNLDLDAGGYQITILGVPEGQGEIHPEKELAINPGNAQSGLRGIPVTDPAFGMEAVWIDPVQRDHAQVLGYTVVDASTVIATHMNKLLLEHAGDLLGHEETRQLLDKLGKHEPRLVEDLTPKSLPLSTIVRVLQNLLQEGIPLRDMRTIAETLAEASVNSQEADTLTAAVRVALRRLITQQINGLTDDLPVITLDPELEQLLLQSYNNNPAAGLVIEPGLSARLHESLFETVQKQEQVGQPSVLLTAPQLRPSMARMFKTSIPQLKVLAFNEIAENKQLRVIASIGGNQGLEHAA